MKQFTKLKYLLLISLINLSIGFEVISQHVEKSKQVKKNYTVSKNTRLSIDNRYGDIHINTWDKNQIDVVVTIKVKRSSEKRASELLENINIDIDGGESSSLIEFVTKIRSIQNTRSNENFSIDYKVKIPKTNRLSVKNKYGNVYISDLNAKLELTVSYGKIRVDHINGDTEIDLAYSGGEIETIGSGDLEISYSNLEIENAGNLEIESKYSNLKFEEVKSISITNKYGNLTFGKITSISGLSKYGGVKIGRLLKSIDLELSYGSGIKVSSISKDFERIALSGEYVTSSLTIERGSTARVEGNFRYGKLKYDNNDIDFNYINTANNSSEYKGIIGADKNPKSLIKLRSSYGSVRIDIE